MVKNIDVENMLPGAGSSISIVIAKACVVDGLCRGNNREAVESTNIHVHHDCA